MRSPFISALRSPGWLVCCCLVFPSTMAATRLRAQDVTTKGAGGTGGEPYTIGCGTRAMVGAQGRSAGGVPGFGQVSVLQALCVDVNTDGTWLGTPAPGPGIAGVNGPSGALVVLTCPRDGAVSGISGFSGMYLDVLSIWCTPLGENGRLNGSAELLAGDIGKGVVGQGGALDPAFGPFSCPDNKPGKGFTGRAHSLVDLIVLICNFPSVPPAAVKDMSTSPPSIVGGNPVNGTVTLNATAPANGTQVTLSVNSALGSFQTNPITVLAGQKVASFVLNTNAVAATRVATITASPNFGSPSAALTVKQPALHALSLSSLKTSLGVAVTGTVSLTGKAFAGGLAVELASSDANAVTIPATVTISAGQPSATFTATAASHPGCSIITTTYNTLKQDAPLAVFAVASTAFTLRESSPSSSATVEVIFPTASKVARSLAVASSNATFASVPSSVQVAADATTARFTVAIQGSTVARTCAVITVADAKGNGNSFAVVNADARVTIISGN